jgi:maleate cis-trans isomerase
MTEVQPRYIYGTVGPVDSGPRDLLREPLLPPDVVGINAGLNISDYTTEGVEDGISRYWDCVNRLLPQKVQSITLGGVPISSQLGRPRVLRLMDETRQKTGLPADSSNEAIIAALNHLGATRIAVASRWADQLNERLVEYLNAAGVNVLAVTTAGQWAAEAFGMSIEKGMVLAMRLGRDAMRRAPNAQALLLPGGTWRSLAAVPLLEEEFDVPVLTNTVATTWCLMDRGAAPPVEGWGRLLANPKG